MFILFYFVIYLYCSSITYSQGWGHAEIKIVNKTSADVNFSLTPVGTVFSGRYNDPIYQYKYSYERSRQGLQPNNWEFISGSLRDYSTNIDPNDYRLIDFDDGDYNSSQFHPERTAGGIGYGLWHLKIYREPVEGDVYDLLDECWIDYRDMNYSYSGGVANDILFEIRDIGNQNYKIYFQFDLGTGDPLPIDYYLIENKTIKI